MTTHTHTHTHTDTRSRIGSSVRRLQRTPKLDTVIGEKEEVEYIDGVFVDPRVGKGSTVKTTETRNWRKFEEKKN